MGKKLGIPFKEQNLSGIINNQTYIDYFNRLMLIAINMFEWVGLDDAFGVGAERMVETCLFNNGRCAFYKDPEKGLLVLNVNPSDKLNVYYLPEKVMLWSLGYNKTVPFSDCVYLMNNSIEYPTIATIQMYAYRLYETERTMDVNRSALKTPILLEGDEKSMLTLKNVYMQYSGNMPVIFGRKNFELNNKVNSIDTKVEPLLAELEDHKHDILNDCLTFLGINSANTDKRERMITDEVKSNDDFIRYCLNVFYKPRINACKEINKRWNLKIEVKVNSELLEKISDKKDDILEEIQKILEESGVNDNGEIYDDNQSID